MKMYFLFKILKRFPVFFVKAILHRNIVLLLIISLFSIDGVSQCADLSPTGDCDGDLIINSLDNDDDNDGILDVNEYSETNVISNSELIITSALSVTDWSVNFTNGGGSTGGFYTGSGESIWLFSDNTIVTVSQNITNVNPYGDSPIIQLPDFRLSDGNPVAGSDFSTLEIRYAGVTYMTVSTQEGVSSFTRPITYLNGAIGTLNSATMGVSSINSTDIQLPSGVPNSGVLEIVMNNSNKDASPIDAIDDLYVGSINVFTRGDTDGDGIPNYLDLDSDGDNCPDALEGNSSLNFSDLDSNGAIDTTIYPVGSISDTHPGVPNNSPASGIGTSQNASQQAIECDPCNNTSSLFTDRDTDGIGDFCDLDDDNDGILDTQEGCNIPFAVSFPSILGLHGFTSGPISVTTSTGLNSPFTVSQTGYVYEPSTNWTLVSGVSDLPITQFLHTSFTGFPNNLDFTFNSSDAKVYVTEVYLHISSIDQIRYVMNTVSNPNITYEIVSKNSLSENLGNGGNLNFGDTDPTTRDSSTADSQLDGDGAGSADGTIRFYRTDGMPLTNLNLVLEVDSDQIASELHGIGMEVITTRDTDGDGTPDCLDTDSDGDTCNDVLESGGNDPNNDGVLGELPTIVDGNGIVTGTGISGGYDGLTRSENIAVSIDVDTPPSNISAGSSTTLVNFTVAASADQATSYSGGVPVYGIPNNGTAGLVYQWYDGDPDSGGIALTNISPYSNVTTASLGVNPNLSLNGKTYFVVISHPNNSCATEKRSASLCVIDDTLVVGDDIICEGSSATITVSNSVLGINYQLRNDDDDSNIGGVVAGTGGTINFSVSPTSTTTYNILANNGTCTVELVDKSTVTVDSNPGIASNTTTNSAICESDTKTLVGSPVGGTWSIITGGGSISGNTYTPADVTGDTNVSIRYTIGASGSCPATTSDVNFIVNVNPGPAVNTTNNSAICESDTKTLIGSPAGGTWSIISGGGSISGNIYTPADVTGDTNVLIRYTVAGYATCPTTTADVSFVVNVNPGPAVNSTNNSAICESDTKTLTGSPAGGTWSIISGGGSISGNIYTPADIMSDTPVTIRYTITGYATCPTTSADITFTVNADPGVAVNTTDNSEICENETKTLVGSPAGGTWSIISGGGSISGNTYTPANVLNDTFVTVRYTITANGSCAATTADVSFTVNADPGVAVNSTDNSAICESATKTLIGSPAGGTWSIISGGGSISGNAYTPADVTSDTNVLIRYTITANGSCAATTADVGFIVNVNPGPAVNSTNNSAICESDTKTLIGSPVGGTWSIISGGGSITGNTYTPADVSVDTNVLIRYTVAGYATCPLTTSDVSFVVNVNPGPAVNTTDNGAICENGTKTLEGSPAGGTWSIVSGGGSISGTTYTPADVASDTPVTVRYSVVGYASCPATTADVTFTVNLDPGVAVNTTDNSAICENTTKTLEGSPIGGNWSIISGGGSISGSTYTPADIVSDTSVTVRYTIAGNGSCTATTADVSFTVNADPGVAVNSTDNSAICESATKTLIGSPTGGTWSIVSGGGSISGNTYTPADVAVDTNVLIRYTVAANGSCVATTADVGFVVNVNPGPAVNSTDNSAICENSTKTLEGSPAGGSWSIVSGGGSITGNTYTPTDITSDTPVTVRYTIAGYATCPATTADVSFTVNADLGTAVNTTDNGAICENDTKTLVGSPAGGSWSVVSGGGSIFGSTYTPADVVSDTSVTVRYTIAANGSCASTAADISFTVNADPGVAVNTTDNSAICENATKTLIGSPAGGTWTIVSGGGSISGSTYIPADVSVDTNVLIRYTVATNGSCPATTADVGFVVNVNPGPSLNTTNNSAICESDTKTLEGSPAGGTWSIVSGGGSITGNTYTPADVSVDTNVLIRYTVAGYATCPATVADVSFVVNVNPGPAVNTTDNGAICESSTKILLGSPAGGIWSIVSGGGSISGNTYSPVNVSADTNVLIRYTVAGYATCSATAADVSFTVNALPDIPSVNSIIQPTCDVINGTINLNGLPTGNWTLFQTGTSSATYNGNTTTFSINTLSTGSYNFTVRDSNNCTASSALTVVLGKVICANNDDYSGTAITGGDSTSDVTDNDTLDGTLVVIGTNPGEITVNPSPTGVTNPTGLTLDPNTGVITVATGTPSGTYTYTYEICENGASPANCDTATVTILVANPIVANNDDYSGTAITGGDTTSDVTDNDTLDGVAVVIGTNPGEVTVNPSPTGITNPTGLTLDPNIGIITVATGTPSGAYTYTYEICENGASPANCDTATATILVENPIVANNDDYSGTAITGGDSTSDVTDNDTLDGVAVVIGTNLGEVTVNPNPNPTGVTNPTGLTLDPNTGIITVATGTPSGTYTYTYEICENGASPANCDTATATILVENPIVANNDDYSGTAITGGDSTSDVTDNDTLDGVAVVIGTNPGEVTVNPNPTGVTNPTGLTLDPNTGIITVAIGTPSGTYTYTYEICENGASPANCDTATVTILVSNPIVANNDDYSGTAITGGDSTSDVTDNDTLDGVAVVIGTNPGEITVNPNPTGVINPTGLTLDPNTGIITVATRTPSGTYTYTYEICENGANPANCDTATVTILVSNPIVANNDDYSGTAITGGDSTSDVTDNDTLDGVAVVIGTNPGEVTVNPNPTGVTNPVGLSLDPATGVITIAVGTLSGIYTYTYEICENGASPSNCDTATATILVENPIVANNDDYSGTAITGGDSTADVTDNDTLDGVAVVIGTNPGEITVNPNPTGVTNPTELTLDPNTGIITVANGTPSGTYTYRYEVCENGASPANCDTATVTILVANPIVANNDDYSGTAITGGDSTSDVTDNDTLDGVAVVIGTNPGEITVNPNPTGITNPTGLTLDPNTGIITVATGTPSGTYSYTYEICENGANPANCDTATVTILVSNPIVANNDDYSGTAITGGDSTSDVTDNDTLDGVAVVIGTNPGEVTVNPNPTGVINPTGLTLDPNTGVINVATGIPSGTYTYTYEICENGANPTNCDTATVTILVANPIVANNDDYSGTAITGGDSTSDVTDNDTLDGVAVVIGTNPGEVTVNPNPTGVTNPTGLTLDPNTGIITVATGTPSGTYTYTYEICENGANPANCDTATATVLVENPIVANNDDYSGTAITAGDSTSDVTDNDTLDGVAVVIGTNPGEVTVNANPTGVTNPTGLTLDPNTGIITVATGTPSGTYTYTYEICENGASPANCDTATATVLVENPIVANNDDYSGTAITGGDSTSDVTDNDTLDGVAVVIGTNSGEVTINPNPTGVTNPTGLTLDPNTGIITVATGTPSGTYSYTYEICENGASPVNCDTATATILVENPIVANNDDYSGTAITGGDSTSDVTDNDTLDGVAVVIGTNPGEVTVNPNPTGVTNPTGLTLDPNTGIITVATGTPSGTYTYTYEICENGANPANCDTAIATILVNNPIVANNDDYSGTAITGGDSTSDVTDNDTLDGVAVVIGTNPGEVTVNPNPTGVTNPAGLSLDPTTGVITIAVGTLSGIYTYTYEICENGASPANCDTATATILVENPIVANNDDYSGTAITGGDSTSDVTDNDTLDGTPVVIGTNPGEVTINPNPTGVTNPTGLTLDPNTGIITVATGTPSGTYTYTYEICENGANPANCDTAIATILVNNPIVANNDDYSGTAITGGDSTSDVTDNDTLDGVAVVIGTNPGEVTVNPNPTGVTNPTGLTLDPNTGIITIATGTPSGTYTYTYEICENGASPVNCDTATAIILVENPIVANNDDYSGTAITGGDSTSDVTDNDTLDGVAVVIGTNPGEVTVNPNPTGVTNPTGLTLDPNTGIITVATGTPSGTYTYTYEICENGASPANCDTATATILVENPIVANNDDYSGTAITGGDSTSDVTDNDTLDGTPVVIGTNSGEVTINPNPTGITNPTGLTLDPNTGIITVATGTPSGTYTYTYGICENGASPANCDTSTVTILVENPIVANNDDYSGTAITGGDSTSDVTDNDTLDGTPVVIGTNSGEVTVNPNPTGVTNPTGLTLDPNTGIITVATGTPSGTYSYTYEICENGASPTNCDTATVTILVSNPIVANNDDYSGTAITGGDSTLDVTDNDTLDGVAVVIGTNPGEVTVNPNPTGVTNPTGLTLDPNTGIITVATGTPSGTYSYTYEICENGANPANCDTAIATILVENPIVANNDDYSGTAITGGDSTSDVTDNDTLDGVAVVIGTNPGEVTVNPNPTGVTNPTGLTLDPNTGIITVAVGTLSGTYTYTYEICENGANPANCDTATVTILVSNSIVANNDDYSSTAITGGDSTSDVTDNDTLDGAPVVIGTSPGEITVNPNPTGVTNPTGFTLDPNTGIITVAVGTPSGTYTYTYEICENGASPANCDTATVTVVVANPIVANNDDYSGTAITGGDSTSDVTDNDTLDGTPVVIGTNSGEVTINPNPTGVTNPTGLTLDPNTGIITVAVGTPSGTYTYTYEICENGASPANCDTATVTVVVANPIVANNDDYSGTAITGGDSTSDVTDNDTLDGTPVVIGTNPGEITVNPNPTGVTNPTGLSLDPATGVITIAVGTLSGIYTYTYEICENGASPANCDTATATVFVGNPLIANNDDYSGTVITGGDSTSEVTDNDTLDGVAVVIGTNPGEITVNPNPTGITNPTGLTLDPNTGIITVSTGTPSGTYTYTYEICENGASPANCDTATVTVVVANPIVANNDDYSGTAITGGDSTSDVTDNDTLDGTPVVIGTNPGEVTVNPNPTGVTNPKGLTLDPNTGIITVAVGTPSGTYTYTYEICENGASPANCDTAIATILVEGNPCGTPYNILTPDDDGDNDVFYISCIDSPQYQKNSVEIFNRWGNTVYKASGYNNEDVAFRGISNGRANINVDEKLPSGTYYYVIDLGDGSKPRIGWLYINR
ncbi:gliding motility-associated C-terminal domain-containing protein [uncultured Tenacibaculum sp.]|uniref:T9SS type B sorting domain-containing protein n=1 Tax=uncultured Tenacibaculum sp. TaxID=174713 RepID=UPI00262EFAE7|nr:gliding motility-associated C-terminal domain-containing protein [uncultured Tenacibaculum sp.]